MWILEDSSFGWKASIVVFKAELHMPCRDVSSSEFSLVTVYPLGSFGCKQQRAILANLSQERELLKGCEIYERKTAYSGLWKNRDISPSLVRLSSLGWVFSSCFSCFCHLAHDSHMWPRESAWPNLVMCPTLAGGRQGFPFQSHQRGTEMLVLEKGSWVRAKQCMPL